MDARFWIAHPLLLARRTELQKNGQKSQMKMLKTIKGKRFPRWIKANCTGGGIENYMMTKEMCVRTPLFLSNKIQKW